MSSDNATPIRVPDIGDLDKVEVIEILVEPGQQIEIEDPLVTLESDKASMDVPSPVAGEIVTVDVQLGSEVGEGDLLATVRQTTGGTENGAPTEAAEPSSSGTADDADAGSKAKPVEGPDQDPDSEPSRETEAEKVAGAQGAEPKAGLQPAEASREGSAGTGFDHDHGYDFDLVVLGSGPGGYTAAFRAADLGLRVALVERYSSLGGVCLNVGCIPSKALLHAARVLDEARESEEIGLHFEPPRIDLDRLREWKDGVVGQLTGGLGTMAKRRGVEVITGTGVLSNSHQMQVSSASNGGEGGEALARSISFATAILAAGSRAVELPFLPNEDARILDSTGALELSNIPERLLVIGGGIIGLEMATVYLALGARVSIVEMMDELMVGVDRDLVRPLQKRLEPRLENLWLSTKVTSAKAQKNGIKVELEGADAPGGALFDAVLVAVGRSPNGLRIGAEAAGVHVDERGFIEVDEQMRTNVPHIFAIGDLTSGPALAHKATHQGKVAAEVAAGEKSGFEARVIPSVAYTDPEVAWVGVTENEAKATGLEVEKASFPHVASGRALGMGRAEGTTKLLFDKQTGRVVGGGVVAPNAGELIAEITLAIEMGCDAADIGLTIHAHPTLSETVAFAAEVHEGTITDLYLPKKTKKK